MPDGTTTLLGATWDAERWLWFALAGILFWNGKKIVNDVEAIKKDYIHAKDFNETLKSLRGDIKDASQKHEQTSKDLRNDVRQDVNSVHQRIDKLMETKNK